MLVVHGRCLTSRPGVEVERRGVSGFLMGPPFRLGLT
jgi:hypothetical protein